MIGCVLVVYTVWQYRRSGEDHGPMFLVVVTSSPDQDRDWVSRQLQIGNWVPCWRVHLRPAAARGRITGEDSDEPVREIRRVQSWLLDPRKCTEVLDWVGDAVVIGDDVPLPELREPPSCEEALVETQPIIKIRGATPPSYGEPLEEYNYHVVRLL